MRSSSLGAHNPFIAVDGLIRVGSRLVNALAREEVKFPIILPAEALQSSPISGRRTRKAFIVAPNRRCQNSANVYGFCKVCKK